MNFHWFILTNPYKVFRDMTPPFSASVSQCTTASSAQNVNEEKAYILLLIGAAVSGLANSGLAILSMSYIDENTPKVLSPFYIGESIIYSSYIWMVGSYVFKIKLDQLIVQKVINQELKGNSVSVQQATLGIIFHWRWSVRLKIQGCTPMKHGRHLVTCNTA